MTEQHPDPGGEATARAAQLAAMTLSVAEALARLRAQRASDRAGEEHRSEMALRTTARIDAARDRAVYAQALSPQWPRTADTIELLTAWHTAGPYLDDDPAAKQASERIEDRLRQLHPEAMAVFDDVQLRGLPRDYRMQRASPLLRGPYGLDPIGTPLSTAERNRGEADLAAPDLRSTPSVDERTAARARAAGHAGRAAATASDLCTDIATQAFPMGIHEAMHTAPAASARAVRAITAGPVRKQLTARARQPHTPRSSR